MLDLGNVSYKYAKSAQQSDISDLSIQVARGECVVVCGRSGSGKTTVTKIINSLIPHYYENGELTGSVSVGGIDTHTAEIYEVSRVVSSVFQNPKTQFFNVNTTSEFLFYLENRGFSREHMQAKLDEAAELFGIGHLFDRDIFELSGGEKQIVAIAGAYAAGTDIVLLDEPSSNLDERSTRLIGDVLAKLKALGKTIIISEHRFYYIADLIDRVYYLDGGIIQGEFSRDEFFSMSDDQRKELGLRSLEFAELDRRQRAEPANKKGLTVRRMHHVFEGRGRALDIADVSFGFGSIVGIYGYNGVGKSTFIRLLMGLERSKSEILIDGEQLSGRKRLKMSYLVMQDVNHQLFTDSVKTEVSLGVKDSVTEADIDEVLHRLHIDDLSEHHPMGLSGGQKQRVAIASAILSGARIICLDEPTSGMDYDNMVRVSELLKATVNEDLLIFVISHDHEFLNRTADEIFDLTACNTAS